MPAPTNLKQEKPETDVVGTLMSLTVAFTMAMAFRGFVLEGFVIPTGSMGPTLMGSHVRFSSPATAYEYAFDAQPAIDPNQRARGSKSPIFDPMISTVTPIATAEPESLAAQARTGDRVLVLKPLFAFSAPQRWDVVVFKNPTDPVGDFQNYIKRMVGLPGEAFLLVDGDVFVGAPDARTQDLKIARKPEFVQRAVWQPLYDSDYQPIVPVQTLEQNMHASWPGVPWKPVGDAAAWKTAPERTWSFSGTGSTTLEWNSAAVPLDDWNAYNALRWMGPQTHSSMFPVSDLRVCATVECAKLASFATTLELTARSSVFRFEIEGSGKVTVTRTGMEGGEAQGFASGTFAPRQDGIMSFECWHVDQQLWVFVNGSNVLQMPYEFKSLDDRVTASMFGRTVAQYVKRHDDPRNPTPPKLSWGFRSDAPFQLCRVQVDRDLYYRPVLHDRINQVPVNGDTMFGPGFATDYEHPVRLSDRDFVMLGDNSAASRDARLWGRPHALGLRTFGDSQPGVVPREMIVGKAWAVYWPAPLPAPPLPFVLDFGRVRFIR